MANTQERRLVGGYRAYYCVAGTDDHSPTMTGTSYPTIGTEWTEFPSLVGDVAMKSGEKWEAFQPAYQLHATDSDLVSVGIDNISFTIKETDPNALKIGLGTALAGTDTIDQAVKTADLPVHGLLFVAKGTAAGKYIAEYYPHVRRTAAEVQRGVGKVATLKYTWDVFAVENSAVIPEGACSKMYFD